MGNAEHSNAKCLTWNILHSCFKHCASMALPATIFPFVSPTTSYEEAIKKANSLLEQHVCLQLVWWTRKDGDKPFTLPSTTKAYKALPGSPHPQYYKGSSGPSTSHVVTVWKAPSVPVSPLFSTNRLVWYPIVARHLWHAVLFPGVKSVCLPDLPAKNVPQCIHMCHIPSPPKPSFVAWGPLFPMHDHLHLIIRSKKKRKCVCGRMNSVLV